MSVTVIWFSILNDGQTQGMGVKADRKRALALCAHALRVGGSAAGEEAIDEDIAAELLSEAANEEEGEEEIAAGMRQP